MSTLTVTAKDERDQFRLLLHHRAGAEFLEMRAHALRRQRGMLFDISSATIRDVVSVMPPGANGTTQAIGRMGNSSAEAFAMRMMDASRIASAM